MGDYSSVFYGFSLPLLPFSYDVTWVISNTLWSLSKIIQKVFEIHVYLSLRLTDYDFS